MKKVFLYAYDKQNLGDDLFVHTIAKRYPHTQFYMWSSKENQKTFACLPNLKVVDKDSRLVRFLAKLRPSLVSRYKSMIEKRCDAVVYIGGSIFMEYPNWEQICTWWEWTAENHPFYVLGANFGPYHSEGYREKMAEIFGKMRDVCFRDKYSYNLFQSVDTVRTAPDILFSYPMPKVSLNKKQVFVSVIDCAGRDESHNLVPYAESYIKNMAQLLHCCLGDGYSLVLASFCKEEGDEHGIAKLLSAMECEKDPRVRVLCYNGTNAGELTTAIAESSYVIATRFHATILAMAAGCPVLPIIYSDKTLHTLNDLNYTGITFDLRSSKSWSYPLSRVNWDNPSQSLTDEIRFTAHQHFQKLDRVLEL